MMQYTVICVMTLMLSDMNMLSEKGANTYDSNPAEVSLSATEIIRRTHTASGGLFWRQPKSLKLSGEGFFYREGTIQYYDSYKMWRIFSGAKQNAHQASGKVRIEAKNNQKLAFVIAFDGQTTYDINGPVADQRANAQWASNFGFGAIRHGLDPGWSQRRLPDDKVDGQPAFFIELTDPAGGKTVFGIAREEFTILSVGFDTPRGWHERRYSDFFSKDGVDWVQSGRVRLFYDGIKQNQIVWKDFEINNDYPDDLFVIAPKH